jgi:eukaryotic-like serine/threonine-protein kinase
VSESVRAPGGADCLDENSAVAFARGLIDDPARAAAIEAHVDACPDCLELVSELARSSDRAIRDTSGEEAPVAGDIALGRGATVGRYVLLERVGAGSAGVVFAAYDPKLDRKVALKILHATGAAPGELPDASTQLLREGRAMAKLTHPNVVTVHDVGVVNDRAFLAMEFVDGTLRDWLGARPRSWKETLRVFLKAGRGLAAAHEKGLVHRDFKPANVLLDGDARVLVTDFGIARSLEGPSPHHQPPALADANPADHPAEAMHTATGTMVGTPAYMAPEQHRGHKADVRSDQFAFCVALYEGLYGERPFAGETAWALREAVFAGIVRPPPKDTRVPLWLRRILVRGLRVDPAQRFPSMGALLGPLSRGGPLSRRRVAMLVGACVTLAGGIAVGEVVHGRNETAAACGGSDGRLAGVWDEDRRHQVHAAFTAVAKPYAEDAFQHVERALDGYARDWIAMQTESCKATRVRGEQSAELLDLRSVCLDRRLDELKAETDLFARADAKVVENAVKAVDALPRLEECANVVSLRRPVAEPADGPTRTRIAEVRRRVAESTALVQAGKYAEALVIAAPAAADARALGFPPLEAEALYQLGRSQLEADDPKTSEQTFDEALLAAERGRDDRMAASALIGLVFVVGDAEARPSDGLALSRHAFAAIDRMGGDDPLLALLYQHVGAVYYDKGQFDEALANARQSLAVAERIYPPGDRRISNALNDVALALMSLGRYEEALASASRAIAIDEAALGRSHPAIAWLVGNEGVLLLRMKRYEEALSALRRSVDIYERTLGAGAHSGGPLDDIGWVMLAQRDYGGSLDFFGRALRIWEGSLGAEHPRAADPLTGMGLALLGEHKPSEALAPIERALAIREGHPGDALALAETQFAMARALQELHRDPGRARGLALKARDAYVSAGDRPGGNYASLTDIDAWLASAR